MYYKVGTIVNTHGIRGELKVVVSTDFPDQRFKKGSELAVFKKDTDTKPQQTVTIASARSHKALC